METRLPRHCCLSPRGTGCARAHAPASMVLPASLGSAVLVYVGPSPSLGGSMQPLPQVASIPVFVAAAPISHLVPTHTGWVMYTLCADVQGGVHIHMGYRSYIHCAYIYIYIYSIYIYIFLHSYIYCTEHSPSTKNSFVTSCMASALKF